MTPDTPASLKAKELLEKFRQFTWATYPRAKKCALICVEMLINEANAEYWESVKKEINKL